MIVTETGIYLIGNSSYGPGNIRNPGDNRVAFLQKVRFYQLINSK